LLSNVEHMFERVGVAVPSVEALRPLAESLRGCSLVELPDARAEEEFSCLHEAVELLEAERLRRLADLERRRVHERDGHLSTASWLVSRHRVAWGAAQQQVRMARALSSMPLTRSALDEGAISLSAVRVLAGAREVDPEAFRGAEASLVEAARIHTVRDLQKVTAFWQQRVQAGESDERRYERRRLQASVTYLGMVRLDGDLDPETGETFMSALGAVLDAEAHARTPEDRRTPAQRRADALGEISRQFLDRSDRPTVAGERPHVVLTVGVEALRGGRDGAACDAQDERVMGFDHTGPVDARTAFRLSCDASIVRVVMGGNSQPLDVGRLTPVVPAGMRRALIIRDRHCRFPGCDRPPSWCDAHHIVHWADGGDTSMENLLLMCRRHHRIVHRHGFSLSLIDGRPVFRRPDGSLLQDGARDRAPP
jgi:Domain of unknown function (DUF222)